MAVQFRVYKAGVTAASAGLPVTFNVYQAGVTAADTDATPVTFNVYQAGATAFASVANLAFLIYRAGVTAAGSGRLYDGTLFAEDQMRPYVRRVWIDGALRP